MDIENTVIKAINKVVGNKRPATTYDVDKIQSYTGLIRKDFYAVLQSLENQGMVEIIPGSNEIVGLGITTYLPR